LGQTAARGDLNVPLLLITTATADYVPVKDDPANWPRLDALHPGRTFRFCFSNRQMARAVADFIWSQDDLRPDAEPVYLAAWKDDPYSLDLAAGFHDILGADGQHRLAAREAALAWAWAAGQAVRGCAPHGLDPQALGVALAPPAEPFWQITIWHSIGAVG